MRRPLSAVAATLAVVAAVSTGCSGDRGGQTPATPTTEPPGPTLAQGPPPDGWKDVHSATGLVYSIPPDWESGGAGEKDPLEKDSGGRDEGTDWGSGFVTSSNTVANPGYCPMSGTSFRLLAGLTRAIPGEAKEQASSAARSLADSIDRRFTQNGAEVPPAEPVRIGVSGTTAWHVTVRGTVHPPRNVCTPPVIRVDAIAVSTSTPDGHPAAIMFVLMADEGESGVVPTETVDRVVASLRFDNSL